MADDTSMIDSAPATDAPTDQPTDLRDAGKQAIDRMKAERDAARKDARANADAARRLAEIEAANATDLEKAINSARVEAAAEERQRVQAEFVPRLVESQFRLAAVGRMTVEQVTELLEDLDLSKYLTDTGEVDSERVAKKVEALAPAEQAPRFPPSFGGGPRQSPVLTDPRAQDLAQIEADVASASRKR